VATQAKSGTFHTSIINNAIRSLREVRNVAKSKMTALLADRAAADRSRRVWRRIMPTDGSDLSQADSEAEFLKAPAAEVVDECYRQFWEATGNFSLQFLSVLSVHVVKGRQ